MTTMKIVNHDMTLKNHELNHEKELPIMNHPSTIQKKLSLITSCDLFVRAMAETNGAPKVDGEPKGGATGL